MVDVVLGALGVVAFAAVVYAGLAGTDSEQDNLAPTAIFVILWVGVPFASLLFGDVFRLLQPVAGDRARGRLGRGARRAGRAARVSGAARALAGGGRDLLLRRRRAVLGGGREPQTLAILALLYLVVAFVGMSLYGVEPWTRNADPFGVYFGLFASLSPFDAPRRRAVTCARR